MKCNSAAYVSVLHVFLLLNVAWACVLVILDTSYTIKGRVWSVSVMGVFAALIIGRSIAVLQIYIPAFANEDRITYPEAPKVEGKPAANLTIPSSYAASDAERDGLLRKQPWHTPGLRL